MSTLGSIERVKHGLVTLLTGPDFTRVLSEVDVLHGDEAGTTPVAAEAHEQEVMSLNSFPAVEVIGLSTDFDDEAEEQAGTHRVGILWTVVGDNEKAIVRAIERLVLATRLLVWRRNLANVGSAPMHVETEEYSQTVPAPNHPFVKGGRLIVSVETFD